MPLGNRCAELVGGLVVVRRRVSAFWSPGATGMKKTRRPLAAASQPPTGITVGLCLAVPVRAIGSARSFTSTLSAELAVVLRPKIVVPFAGTGGSRPHYVPNREYSFVARRGTNTMMMQGLVGQTLSLEATILRLVIPPSVVLSPCRQPPAPVSSARHPATAFVIFNDVASLSGRLRSATWEYVHPAFPHSPKHVKSMHCLRPRCPCPTSGAFGSAGGCTCPPLASGPGSLT
jgi:hypothetical protein